MAMTGQTNGEADGDDGCAENGKPTVEGGTAKEDALTASNSGGDGAMKTRSLQEHLHDELRQLIAVTYPPADEGANTNNGDPSATAAAPPPPPNDGDDSFVPASITPRAINRRSSDAGPVRRRSGRRRGGLSLSSAAATSRGLEDGGADLATKSKAALVQHQLMTCTPEQLLRKHKNEERRGNKVKVVSGLVEALREDRARSRRQNSTGGAAEEGNDGDSNVETGGRIHGCVGSRWELLPPVYPDDLKRSFKCSSPTEFEQIKKELEDLKKLKDAAQSAQPLVSGGGLRLPGLDWNKTFRKGYSVLVWVRPTLDLPSVDADDTEEGGAGGGGVGGRSGGSGKEARPPWKQVLYRFATGPQDSTPNSAGVCAILGQWRAVPLSDDNDDGGGGGKTMLTTTVTAYTLPNSDPMSHLYPSTKDELSSSFSKSGRSGRRRNVKDPKSPSIGFKGGSSQHARNMEQFQKAHGGNVGRLDHTSSNQGRLAGKAKKGASEVLGSLGKERGRSDISPGRSPGKDLLPRSALQGTGGYVTANITLPADEWSLIGIQHTHPYLRRPELHISVNGEEMMKGELSYPVLDAVVFGDEAEHDTLGGSGFSLTSSSQAAAMEAAAEATRSATEEELEAVNSAQERQLLRKRGILAECTLLDGAFDNGVLIADSSLSSSFRATATASELANPTGTVCSCTAAVHSVALIAGPPVPNAVLAIVAERGPLGDAASAGRYGLSFVLGPVPTNPQNRDAVVALSAGHGYYGATPEGSDGRRGSVGSGKGGGGGGVLGGGGRGAHSELAPPRSLGIPVSIGITPGVYPIGGAADHSSSSRGGSSSDPNSSHDETWIGRGEEHAAHVCLQGLLGRVAWTFHSGDTKTLEQLVPSATSFSSARVLAEAASAPSKRKRMICPPSAAPARIGGADAVPKVGIVRPTPPCGQLPSTGLEITGNARYRNVSWSYLRRVESEKKVTIAPSAASLKLSSHSKEKYDLADNLPISFPRAVQASNAMNLALLPFRLALPRTGMSGEVNDAQRMIHLESFAHLNDLLSNKAELAAKLIGFVTECIRCGGSAMRDEALQNGVIHVLATLVRKVLIRGARLGMLIGEEEAERAPRITAKAATQALVSTKKSMGGENLDYDKDHDASCPPVVPPAVSDALVGLIDACCGPDVRNVKRVHNSSAAIIVNPCRGLLRVRRASDLALTALFGLGMDFDLLGNDPVAAAPVLEAIAGRYCRIDATSSAPGGEGGGRMPGFAGEDYGSLLRKQINLQYFLDCLRIRFDRSVVSSAKCMFSSPLFFSSAQLSSTSLEVSVNKEMAVESVASSLSDILYTMLLSTLTSAAGVNVTRGERDVGALVATLTECPLGSITAHVVTTTIARLLVKCGVMSSLCLGFSTKRRKSSRRGRDPEDIALESRLGRNMLLCHYHDIVAPLLLSRSTPRSGGGGELASEKDGGNGDDEDELHKSIDFTTSVDAEDVMHSLDWTHHWRLSLLTFVWLSSLAGMDESQSISTSTGHLLLLAGKAGSLDGAILGYRGDKKKSAGDMLAVLSHFLVLSSSREKDNSVIGKRAESISRRLSAFMPLVPGIALSLLSSSIVRSDPNTDQTMRITSETALAVDTLKQLLSMLSLAIQALYGSKKGGLLSSKAGTKGGVQLNRAKKIFVSGAKEYVPIMLQVVLMLDEPIQLSRQLVGSNKGSSNNKEQSSSPKPTSKTLQRYRRPNSDGDRPMPVLPVSEPLQRKRIDSSDKDWVDISNSTEPDDVLTPLGTITIPPPTNKTTATSNSADKCASKQALEQSVCDDLASCQDMALYAVSRLVAQAMKYGGGEASTAVWRNIVASLSGNGPTEEKKAAAAPEVTPATVEAKIAANAGDSIVLPLGQSLKDYIDTQTKPEEKTLSKSTLCHLAALVLSKFARHHDNRLSTYRSPWSLETCSAVARLMDLVEEKQLLSRPEKSKERSTRRSSVVLDVDKMLLDQSDKSDRSESKSESWSRRRRGSNISTGSNRSNRSSRSLGSSSKYGIDQVRLLKALLEVMASGRESGGWSQAKLPQGDDGKAMMSSEDEVGNGSSSTLGVALPHNNYELYHQASSNDGRSTRSKDGASNSKLLLPILMSCVRIVVPATGIIRSEAVVITAAAAGKAPSTAKLLELVSAELNQSLTSGIEGLGFPVSRDIFMNAIASLRRSITHHQLVGDAKAAALCSNLLLAIVKAMRLRYAEESNRKEKASFDAYEDDEVAEKSKAKAESSTGGAIEKVASKEGLASQVIEKIILGGDNVIPKNDADFVSFPGDANHDGGDAAADSGSAKLLLSPMGWSHYKGLGAALNRCRSAEMSSGTPEEEARSVLSTLEPFVDNWDRIQIQDAAEAELVDLFDDSMNLADPSTGKSQDALDSDPRGRSKGGPERRSSVGLVPSLSASDAMARFIEAQSTLRGQHRYLAYEYLLRRRFGRSAFVERLCWKTWMDCVDAGACNALWERAANDGGRDFSSKITTLPLFPQFPRFIPSYLDHSASITDMDIKEISQSIRIVDITKKEISEEMLEMFDSMNEAPLDEALETFNEEEADLHFAERRRPSQRLDESDDDSTDKEKTGSGSDDNADAGCNSQDETLKNQLAIEQGSFHFAASSFSFPPDSSSLNSMGEGRRLGGGSMEEYYSSCIHVKPDCTLKCTIMLTESHLIVEYEVGDGGVEGENESRRERGDDLSSGARDHEEEKHMREALRPRAMRWNISEASHIYLRRYRLRDSALELFFIPSAGATTGGSAFFAGCRSLFIDFGTGTWGNTRRDDAANAIMKRAPMQTVKQWPDKSGQFLHDELRKLTQAWVHGAVTNFDYLLSLNVLSGRSYNDICQYPVFPWVLSNYTSEEVPDLTDRANFRDMTKPMGAINEERLEELLDRFRTFDDPTIPPFMYGSHYSTSAGVVIHFLLRLHPFGILHRQLQSGHFDVADRLFSSVQRTWDMCTGRSAAEVKELTPEFYSNPAFLRNTNEFKLGTSQEGEVLGDVILPPWAKGSPEKFVEVMRLALESDICSEMLPDWIDLIFGRKQQGKAAIEAQNVYFYLTYYGSVDVANIEDEGLRQATELQIAHFGQCPMQLFYRRHAKKQARDGHRRRQTLSDLYDMKMAPLSSQRSLDKVALERTDKEDHTTGRLLPFMDAPLSYWVHLGAPPPGPHAPLISIRLALSDRCLAVDSKGIFHFFRWAWKPEFEEDELSESDSDTNSHETEDAPEKEDIFSDKGCFVAQRELFSFRNIPRLPYASVASEDTRHATVGVSKTLFANKSLLLVVSDGDGKGALAMQLVDPIKGEIRGEVIVPSIHADCVTSIDMDPIGTASGQGGVGGELVIVGSADGSVTLWRFISSHYWPLRPRLRMMGHGGASIFGVAVSSALGVCASVSSKLCCLFDVGNGAMIRNFTPPTGTGSIHIDTDAKPENVIVETTFADTSAVCLSVLGFVIAVSSTKLILGEDVLKEVLSLELYTVEGRHVGSHPLEPQRGVPKKMFPTVDGRAVFVCAGGGVSVHLVSSIRPLATVDRWRLSEDTGNDASTEQVIYDLDFGPTVARPVVAAAGCTAGTLRLHALQGISRWSQEHQRNTVSSAVGSVLALPAQTVKNALGGVSSFGSNFFGSAKEISKEAFTVVKEREGGFFFRKRRGRE